MPAHAKRLAIKGSDTLGVKMKNLNAVSYVGLAYDEQMASRRCRLDRLSISQVCVSPPGRLGALSFPQRKSASRAIKAASRARKSPVM